MHFVKAKGILSQKGGMNIYRGCQHGCIYCDSRSVCYNMEHDFEDIEVKENATELLDFALRHKRDKCMIGTGSMSDPYMPAEYELCLTKKAAELALKHGFGFTVITKSDLILRDLELLKEINQKTKCVVQMTLTCMDERVSRIIEPSVCTTKRRIEVLNILRDNGIPSVVWLCPVLPFITDTEENITGILNACKEADVKGIICFGMGVTLREGNREYFYDRLDEAFPGLKQKYINLYGNSYMIESPNGKKLMKIFHSFCEQNKIMHQNDEIFKYLNTYETNNSGEQLTLF